MAAVSDKSQSQHPAFYAVVVMLIIMAVGPIALMLSLIHI